VDQQGGLELDIDFSDPLVDIAKFVISIAPEIPQPPQRRLVLRPGNRLRKASRITGTRVAIAAARTIAIAKTMAVSDVPSPPSGLTPNNLSIQSIQPSSNCAGLENAACT
jgi:hypothetical protein